MFDLEDHNTYGQIIIINNKTQRTINFNDINNKHIAI